MPLDNKISNIIGTKLPQWLLKQIELRSNQNSQQSRDNSNILYLANKSAWVRLVSSVDLINESDLNYFNSIVGDSISKQSDLAKQFVLFGGTSKYLQNNKYQLRSGLNKDGAYGTLGTSEVQQYGYKPMPGITNVSIETQGRLGSVRSATINFKCWDKAQLDIIDALYFKLGFTMFLEWGNTAFYTSKEPTRLQSSELYSVDPFSKDLSKEEIYIQLAKNSRESEGNYDGMLGIVTNFTFSFTQDGGFDCQLRLMALGVLADSIKINNVGVLPALVEAEIRKLNNTLIEISNAQQLQDEINRKRAEEEAAQKERESQISILRTLNSNINQKDKEPTFSELGRISQAAGYPGSSTVNINNYDYLYDIKGTRGWSLFLPTFGASIPTETINELVKSITLNNSLFFDKVAASLNFQPNQQISLATQTVTGTILPSGQSQIQQAIQQKNYLEYLMFFNSKAADKGNQYRLDIKYTGANTKIYYGSIRVEFATNNPQLKSEILNKQAVYEATIKQLRDQSNYEFTNIGFQARPIVENFASTPKPFGTVDKNTNQAGGRYAVIALSAEITVEVPGTVLEQKVDVAQTITVQKQGTVQVPVKIDILTTDPDLISNITKGDLSPNYLRVQETIENQNQAQAATQEQTSEEKKALDTQISEAVRSQSNLELTLRAIQLHALNEAISQKGLDIQRLVFTLKLTEKGNIPFLKQIFSNGIFSSFIEELVSGNISISGYNNTQSTLDRLQRLKIQAKYGFATSLMGDSSEIELLSSCKFETLLQAFVVPYQINQEIIKGVETNHPVYIPLGFLLMILNHSCTIYDSKPGSATQTPLVYIDFNSEHNYFLSNTKQLSTNPWVTLIPFEGSFNDYKKIFDINVLNGDNIQPPSGSQEVVPLFNPEKQDVLSGQLPKIKFDGSNNNLYRGKMMNILLNIDYLIKTAKEYSYRDGTNSIYLKEFIEQILTDVNKYLGNINIFRLSYNDKGNTFQIIDDQFIPVKDQEEQLDPKDIKRTLNGQIRSNTTELPLFGKNSIAKTLDIKSDISSKLANMLAISANADFRSKATLSKNGDNYGYINTSYQDRYISTRQEIQNTANATSSINLDSVINSTVQFNQTISDFYSKINPSEATVGHATNYYIDRMTKIKNEDYPTRASAMIPVSVNFTTDGISGFLMGQGFTIPDELLPYTYNTRKVPGSQGLQQDHINKVGFVVVGLTHTLENNQWNTNVRANMIFLKDSTEFEGRVIQTQPKNLAFGENENKLLADNPYVAVEKSTPIGKDQAIKIAKTFFEQKGFTPIQVSAIIGALLQESELNPNAINPSSKAYGIAQWLGTRKAALLLKPGYSKLEVQLSFIIEEFNTTEIIAGTRLRNAKTLEEAIAAMASYERYKGITISSTYKDVLVAEETGFRIGYTKNIFNRYYSI